VSFEPARVISVFFEPEDDLRLPVGRLARRGRELLFEYDLDFLARGLPLSPFKLPLRPGVFAGDPEKFNGLPGVFDDSLPDGWGRLLIDRRAAKAGIPREALGPLDRLLMVGHRAMGALVYEPQVELEPPSVVRLSQLEADARAVLGDGGAVDLERLIALGGSPQGARPKVLVQLGPGDAVIHGEARPRPGCEPWMVKFRAPGDDRHAGNLEHAYLRMAAAAGIDVPASRLLARTSRHPGYFAVKRFDRVGGRRLHLHTLAGLLHAPPASTALSYRDLLLTTRELTRNEADVTEMFRRACFNVLAHNRDDHSRNFAFLMDARGAWRASPAYDLTFSQGPGGEHALLVDTEGAHPDRTHLERLAASVGIKRGAEVIDGVRAAVAKLHRFAEAAGVPSKRTAEVARALGVPPAARRTPARRAKASKTRPRRRK
jgi:serine/threonine-protein kinase HipA